MKNLISTFAICTCLVMLLNLSADAQTIPDLLVDGAPHTLSYSSSNQTRDFKIPLHADVDSIVLVARGAGGGHAKYWNLFAAGFLMSPGGNGAIVEASFKIGNGPNEIPRGSIIRFIPGEHGGTLDNKQGGGGGGSGVFFKHPTTGNWHVLLVAGAGGGGHHIWFATGGQGGRSGTCTEDRCGGNAYWSAALFREYTGLTNYGHKGWSGTINGSYPNFYSNSAPTGGDGGDGGYNYGSGGFGVGGGSSGQSDHGGAGGGYAGAHHTDLRGNGGSSLINTVYGVLRRKINGTTPTNLLGKRYQDNEASGECVYYFLTDLDCNDPSKTIQCPDNKVVSTWGCSQVVDYQVLHCSDVTITNTSVSPSSGAAFPAGITTVSYRAMNSSNVAVASCSFTVTVNEHRPQPPTVTCPADVQLTMNSCQTSLSHTIMDPLWDNCPLAVWTASFSHPDGVQIPTVSGIGDGHTYTGPFNKGETTVTLSGTDRAGYSATPCTFKVTVSDPAPTLTCPSNITVNNDPGQCGAAVSYNAPTLTDNCPSTIIPANGNIGSGGHFPIGITTENFTVSDASGNTASCSFDITVNDIQPISISCPIQVFRFAELGKCGAIASYSVTVYDNCPGFTLTQTDQSSLTSGDEFPAAGATPQSYQVTDASGQTATCSFTVVVVDSQAPTLNCPTAITVNSDPGKCGAVVNYTITGNDNCPGFTINQTDASALTSGDEFPVGSTVQSYQNIDVQGFASGLVGNCSFTVHVTDNEAPTINCPAAISVNSDLGKCGAVVNYTVTGNDNCTGYTINQTDASALTSGNEYPVGNTLQSYQVTDAAGNTASCSFTLTVIDNQAPTISCPSSMSVPNDAGTCGARVTYPQPQSQDNCSISTVQRILGQGSGDPFLNGITTVTYRVTDASGNTAVCSFQVTVEDTEAPTVSCPANINQNSDPGQCNALVGFGISINDNCSGASLSQTAGLPASSAFPIGMTTNRFTVTDASGNTASCSFIVTVTDNEDPAISCPANISLSNDAGQCDRLVSYTAPTGTDNCTSNTEKTAGLGSGLAFTVGTTTEVYTVTDASGNTASCSFDVIINDTEVPVISCPSNITLANDAGQCDRMVTYLAPTSSDNCNSSTQQTAGLGSGSTFSVGTTTETYMVTDASGNTATCSFSITINDDEAPVISLPGANPQVLCEGDSYIESGATATDNCDVNVGQNIVTNNSSVNTAVAGNYTVTYTVTDVHGNSAQATRSVIVKPTPIQLASQNCGSCAQIRFDFCEGDSHPDLEALLRSNSNYLAGASFNWYVDNNGSQGNPRSLPSLNMASNNRTFYWVSQSFNGCEGPAKRVRLRVRKTSTVVLDLPAIGCGTAQLDLAAWVSDSRNIASAFSFYENDPALSGSLPIGSVSATNGVVNSGQYAIVSLPSSPITYYAVASNNTGCQVTGSDEVQAGAGASLAPISNQTVNSGDLVHVSFSSPDATHIMWMNLAFFNNPAIGITGSMGMGDLIFSAYNPTSNTLTATIRAIAYNGNCAGQVRDFTITVNPGTQNRQAQNSLLFTASKINAHDVELNWQIEYEFALTHIEIEKQKNENDWTLIGTSSSLRSSHVDRGGMGNVTKYRLKLVHADGRTIWSHEVEVNFNYYDNKRFTLYPNPTNGRFSLRAAGTLEGEWRYKLSDGMGRTILIGSLNDSETAFDISHLPTAYYFLVITSPEGKSYLRKVAKR